MYSTLISQNSFFTNFRNIEEIRKSLRTRNKWIDNSVVLVKDDAFFLFKGHLEFGKTPCCLWDRVARRESLFGVVWAEKRALTEGGNVFDQLTHGGVRVFPGCHAERRAKGTWDVHSRLRVATDRRKKPAFSSACVCQQSSYSPAHWAWESPGVFCNRVLVASGAKPAYGGKCWAETTFVGLDCLDVESATNWPSYCSITTVTPEAEPGFSFGYLDKWLPNPSLHLCLALERGPVWLPELVWSHKHTHAHAHIHTHTQTDTPIHTRTHAHRQTDTHTRTRTHARTHTHTPLSVPALHGTHCLRLSQFRCRNMTLKFVKCVIE